MGHRLTLPQHKPTQPIQRIIMALCVVLYAAFSGLIASHTAQAQDKRPLVLLLHSYAVDMQWTHDLDNGIISKLSELKPNYRIRSEFMDTKNFLNAEHLATLRHMYAWKYGEDQPIGIIASDNNAMNFLNVYGHELFPEVTTVAAGINNAKPPKAHDFISTIIREDINHHDNLEIATKLWPATKTINVIVDESTTSMAMLQEVQETTKDLAQRYKFRILRHKTVPELEAIVSELDETNLVYIFPFHLAIDGKIYTEKAVTGRIAKSATVPVIASTPNHIGTGALLSSGISATKLSTQVAETMVDKLDGKFTPRLLSGESSQVTIYDYNVLSHFKINSDLLPDNAIVMNRPVGFFEKHKSAILPATAAGIVLLIIALLLVQNIRKQKILDRDNRRILSLDGEVIETQKELLSTLGEVIEARSEEGSNHVKRVAAITVLIAKALQLPPNDLRLLAAAVSMHDIGKIAVPESILRKPGKLTADEYELVKTHTTTGKAILHGSDRPLMQMACVIAYEHHEKWDGTGYPQNLHGNEINIYARIVCVADVYDALISRRCYKDAWNISDALTYIVSESGKSFDPMVVDAFVAQHDKILELSDDPQKLEAIISEQPEASSELTYQI